MRLKCEICGEKFDATHSRSWGDHCSPCAGWIRALAKGPFQNFTADYQRLGMVVAYLIKKNELKEDDFIHGVDLPPKNCTRYNVREQTKKGGFRW